MNTHYYEYTLLSRVNNNSCYYEYALEIANYLQYAFVSTSLPKDSE